MLRSEIPYAVRVVKQIIRVMARVRRQGEPKVWRARIKAESVPQSKLRLLNNLIHVEAVHDVGRLADADGAWQAALREAEVVHAA